MTKIRLTLTFLCWVSLASPLLDAGCASTTPPAANGSETNWLRRCTKNADCDQAGTCICGLCSERCAQDTDCASGLTCQRADSTLVTDACINTSASGLCAPACKTKADCGSLQSCVKSVCAPAPASASRSGTATPSTLQAYAVAVMVPSADCVYSVANQMTRPRGLFDIAANGTANSNGVGTACSHPYEVSLEIASNEPRVIQLSGAMIELTDLDRSTIVFNRTASPMPNPFTFTSSLTLIPSAADGTTTGVFTIEVIRESYAAQLDNFVGSQILASITVEGRDEKDAPITFRPFVYPIDICDGCNSLCQSNIPVDMSRKDVIPANVCDDNSGNDDRICIDPAC